MQNDVLFLVSFPLSVVGVCVCVQDTLDDVFCFDESQCSSTTTIEDSNSSSSSHRNHSGVQHHPFLPKMSLRSALQRRNAQGRTAEEVATSVGNLEGAALLQSIARLRVKVNVKPHAVFGGGGGGGSGSSSSSSSVLTGCSGACLSGWVLSPMGCFMLPLVLFSTSVLMFETCPMPWALAWWVLALGAGWRLIQVLFVGWLVIVSFFLSFFFFFFSVRPNFLFSWYCVVHFCAYGVFFWMLSVSCSTSC
jgi:hypothetical protein